MTENEGQYRSNGQQPAHKKKITRFPPPPKKKKKLGIANS